MNSVLVERTLSTGQTVQIVQGDITVDEVDAIVNAANEQLQHGGGVAWAISKRGGATVQKESDDWVRKHGPVPHSHPAWTLGGLLPAKYIIHAVGPVWGDGDEDKKLSDAVTGSLRVADELKCKSISMPAISTGIFGFPKDRAAKIIFSAIETYFTEVKNSTLQTVRLVLFDDATIKVFLDIWNSTKSS
ncbi:MAG: macro domain-containing protein [Anaerolineales bacterium]|jgi:O-acetyl-ADP-ribose deacetylase (regulator of RNase III)|nr:macro domain-containing protein [Anaerolineales bacterium]